MTQLPLPFAARSATLTDIIARLLVCANAGASRLDDETKWTFYRLKDRLLRQYGEHVGYDVQEIKLLCRACHGRGQHGWGWRRDYCRRCYGSGIWEKRYIELARWSIAGRILHIPGRRLMDAEMPTVTIKGKIHHDDPGPIAFESTVFLALLFDRRSARQLILRGPLWGTPRWTPYPMAMLQNAALYFRQAWWELRRNIAAGNVDDIDYDIPF